MLEGFYNSCLHTYDPISRREGLMKDFYTTLYKRKLNEIASNALALKE